MSSLPQTRVYASESASYAVPGRRKSPRGITLVTRTSFPPSRLGNPRRQAKGLLCSSAKRDELRREAHSLDSCKHLATSSLKTCHDVLREAETRHFSDYQKSCWRQAKLLESLKKIVDGLDARIERMEGILFNPACEEWLKKHPALDGKLQNKFVRVQKHRERRLKDYDRLQNCHQSWIALKATCCNSRPLAVPIVCNHRLCFLCNARRAERYRERVRVLFDRLTHPSFLTITVPNIPAGQLRKRVYSTFRVRWNKFRKNWKDYIQGGIFAFETTYNNQPNSASFRTWHVHAHVLIDGSATLPVCRCKAKFTDERTGIQRRRHGNDCAFIRFKRRLEFDWLCATQGNRRERWRASDFNYWFSRTIAENWRDADARHQWNRENRRTVDIRRVTDRKKAAFEVLKYATKASYFCDVPEAVNEFIDATKGMRMLQTFGTWYGFDFDDDGSFMNRLECGCGQNQFERIGVIFRESVEMDKETGKWHPREFVFRGDSPPI